MQIRPLTGDDWPATWAIIHDVITTQETFPYDPAMTEEQARGMWVESAPGLTVVAVDGDRVLATAKMGPNRPGPGAHISTASFMVASDARGRGVGTALCRYALDWARRHGYAGMQFNAVVDSNETAVRLYQREGFTILGTVPGAFRHPSLGLVGLHLMYRPLPQPTSDLKNQIRQAEADIAAGDAVGADELTRLLAERAERERRG